MTKHIVYAASAAEGERRPAAISGLGDILAFRDLDPAAVTQGLQPGGKLAVEIGGVPFTAPLPPLARGIAKRLDGRRTLGQVLEAIRTEDGAKIDETGFLAQTHTLMAAFGPINRLLIRRAGGG